MTRRGFRRIVWTPSSGTTDPLDGPRRSDGEAGAAALGAAAGRMPGDPARGDRVRRRRWPVEPAPLARDEFAAALRALRPRYWDRHRFHVRLHAGAAAAQDVRRWVANRWYYQSCLAQKNAAIVASCPLPDVRRAWLP